MASAAPLSSRRSLAEVYAALEAFVGCDRGPEPWPGISPAEWLILGLVWLGAAAVQLNAIRHHGVMGQDFQFNYDLTKGIAADLSSALHFHHTNPPFYHLAGALIIRATGGVNAVTWIGWLNLAVNAVALVVLFRLTAFCIRNPVLRVSYLVLAAFLPLRLIHSIVNAGDAFTVLPFFAAALLLIKLQRAPAQHGRLLLGLALGVVLTLGVLTKYTFLSCLAATVLVLAQIFRRGGLSGWEAVQIGAASVFLPAVAAGLQLATHGNFSNTMGLKHGTPKDAFDFVDVVSLSPRDRIILAAPPYNAAAGWNGADPTALSDGPASSLELLIPHEHSYPALTHLDVFTDTLNVFQNERSETYFGRRSGWHQALMALAVKTSLPLTVASVVAVALVGVLGTIWALIEPGRSRVELEAVGLLSFGWFGNIALFLPYVSGGYAGGYWTARLILPAVLGFLLLLFFALDRVLRGRGGRIASWGILSYVLLQSALHVSFLWPRGAT